MKALAPLWVAATATLSAPAVADPPYGARTASDVRSEVKRDRQQGVGDGTYGRLDGDLDLGLGAGAIVDMADGELGLGARASAHWFFVAGVYVSYVEGFDSDLEPPRRLGVGIDLRPLFLPRWSQDWEHGPATLDLMIDSLSLGLGASFDQPRGRGFGARHAFEASLGFGFPLAAWGPGPWLEARGALAWPDLGERSATLLLFFTWHLAVETPFVRGD